MSVTPPGLVSSALPSVAMSRGSNVAVGLLCVNRLVSNSNILDVSTFNFDTFMPPVAQPIASIVGDHEPSMGISDLPGGIHAATWSNDNDVMGFPGLLYEVQGLAPAAIRPCNPSGGNVCFVEETFFTPTAWQPALWQRSDGVIAICFADAEIPSSPLSPFDIKLQLFDPTGIPIGAEVLVNDPNLEGMPSTQQSPAVAFDDAGNIVCAWVGANLPGCDQGGVFRVFARRFQWNGDPGAAPTALSQPFQVDSATDARPISGFDANPTVALSMDNSGRFIVAWNATVPATPPEHAARDEIRAQFFAGDGRAMGTEFRLNQDTSNTDEQNTNLRRLANSAQHTIAYNGKVVATWNTFRTNTSGFIEADEVRFTLLPADFPQQQEALFPCLKGDVDRNGVVDGLDIQPFVDLMLMNTTCLNIVDLCPADIDNSAAIDINDVPGFVCLLLGAPCGQGSQRGDAGNTDCNANGVPDATDIFLGTSTDCNGNFIPDECDVDPADPDGDGLTSNDLNANGIPDRC